MVLGRDKIGSRTVSPGMAPRMEDSMVAELMVFAATELVIFGATALVFSGPDLADDDHESDPFEAGTEVAETRTGQTPAL